MREPAIFYREVFYCQRLNQQHRQTGVTQTGDGEHRHLLQSFQSRHGQRTVTDHTGEQAEQQRRIKMGFAVGATHRIGGAEIIQMERIIHRDANQTRAKQQRQNMDRAPQTVAEEKSKQHPTGHGKYRCGQRSQAAENQQHNHHNTGDTNTGDKVDIALRRTGRIGGKKNDSGLQPFD